MAVFVHTRDRVFRLADGILPVPLDPDLLFLAENAKQQNIIQDLYRTQMERNRSRMFHDDYDPNQPRDPKSGEWKKGGRSQAKKGGEVAESNKAFYKGGQFLPSTEAPPGTYKIGKKVFGKGNHQISPGKWEKAPTPLHRPLYEPLQAWTRPSGAGREYLDVPYAEREKAKARGAKFDWEKKKWYLEKSGSKDQIELRPDIYTSESHEPVTREMDMTPGIQGYRSTEKMTLGDRIDRYNRGERWVEVKLPKDVQVLMGKPTHDDAEWKEHEHPRDEGGKFTAGQAKAKVPSAAPEGAPPAKQPQPQSLREIDEENKPTAHTHRWMLEKGFKFDHYDDYTDELFFWHKDGGTIAIPRKTQSDFDTHWRYKSPIDGLWRSGEFYSELAEQLGTAQRKKHGDFPPELQHATEFFKTHNYMLDNYDPKWDTWTFKGENKDRIEVRGSKTGEHTAVHWEHRAPYGTFKGEGWTALERHLEEYNKNPTGEAHTPVIRHYQRNLKDMGFNLDTEYPTVAIFKNSDGDLVEVFHSTAEKEDAFNRWTLKPADSTQSEWRTGNGVGTLKETLQALPEFKKEMQKVYEGMKAHWTEIGRDLVKALGYRPERFEVTDEDHQFTLNGVKQFAAGTHWHNGDIKMHAKRLRHLTDRQFLGIVAHETMHEKFQTTREEYGEESTEIQHDQRNGAQGRYVIEPSGAVREEFKEDYPVYAAMAPYFSGDEGTKLRKTDGVTPYSREHWKSYESHEEGGSSLELAINETLAEMAYLETTDPAEFKKAAKPWRDLYKRMVELYRVRGARTQYKMAHARERAAWRGAPPATPLKPLPQQPVFSGEPHPAVTALAHALHQVLAHASGDKKPFHEEDVTRNQAKGHEGEFASQGGGGSKQVHVKEPKPRSPAETNTGSEKPKTKLTEAQFNGPKPRLPKSAENSHPATISTRRLGGVKAESSDKDEYRRADVETMRQYEENFDHDTALFDNAEMYPNFRPGELDCPPARGDASDCAEHRARTIIDHFKKNLQFLYDQAPKVVKEQGHLWYEGAHRLAEEDAERYGLPLPAVVGVYASLSPQKLWDMNVYLAKQVLETYATKQDFKWNDKMDKKGSLIVLPKQPKRKPEWTEEQAAKSEQKYKEKLEAAKIMLESLKGKTLSELETLEQKAWWIRVYDEAHHNRHFDALSPDGRVVGTYMTKSGNPATAAWNTNTATINALKALTSGGDREKISPAMGDKHKVRSFYNNILDPDSDNGDVTVDTHAVGAALLGPYGGSHTSVMHSLGMSPSSGAERERLHFVSASGNAASGLDGTYPLYAEAYRELAETLGIKPRVLQSITWEAKRRLFDETMKDEAKARVVDAWRKYHDGKASLEQTQKEIVKIAGGFAKGQGESDVDTEGQRDRKSDAKTGHTGDARQFHRDELGRGRTRTVDTGGRGRDTSRVAVGARRIWQNARFTVFMH